MVKMLDYFTEIDIRLLLLTKVLFMVTGKTYHDYLKENQNRSIEELNKSVGNWRLENTGDAFSFEEWAKPDEDDLKEFKKKFDQLSTIIPK